MCVCLCVRACARVRAYARACKRAGVQVCMLCMYVFGRVRVRADVQAWERNKLPTGSDLEVRISILYITIMVQDAIHNIIVSHLQIAHSPF